MLEKLFGQSVGDGDNHAKLLASPDHLPGYALTVEGNAHVACDFNGMLAIAVAINNLAEAIKAGVGLVQESLIKVQTGQSDNADQSAE